MYLCQMRFINQLISFLVLKFYNTFTSLFIYYESKIFRTVFFWKSPDRQKNVAESNIKYNDDFKYSYASWMCYYCGVLATIAGFYHVCRQYWEMVQHDLATAWFIHFTIYAENQACIHVDYSFFKLFHILSIIRIVYIIIIFT